MKIWIIWSVKKTIFTVLPELPKFLSCLDATQDGHAYIDDQDVRFQLGGGAE